ncbi:hypothetical protein [Pseudomonas sp. NPDC087639]|uniref:hypothetical protein n=1 Tax=Pseudomonas sp. NPDC087639 TaxID=3364445 RepID=UPI0037F5A2A7
MKRTLAVLELFAFGMDSTLAETLQADGWTPHKLRQRSDWELMHLDLSPVIRQSLQDSQPPAIPVEMLMEVLDANRNMCCMCRFPNQPIVAHTINSLAAGEPHSAQNLAILCKYHQIEAQSTRSFTNACVSAPPPSWLVTAKKAWEACYDEPDLISIKQTESKYGQVNWWYFNLTGLCEAVKPSVDLQQLPSFHSVFTKGLCDSEGFLDWADGAPSPYQGAGGLALYSYMFEILFELLGLRSLRNIYSTDRQPSVIGTVHEGDLVCVHGEHVFNDYPSGKTDQQLVRSTCEFRRVEISFVFDLREATSKLARSTWLCHQSRLASILLVSRAGWIGTKYCIVGTVMAIRSAKDQARVLGGLSES